jgi:hypothetical protein
MNRAMRTVITKSEDPRIFRVVICHWRNSDAPAMTNDNPKMENENDLARAFATQGVIAFLVLHPQV